MLAQRFFLQATMPLPISQAHRCCDQRCDAQRRPQRRPETPARKERAYRVWHRFSVCSRLRPSLRPHRDRALIRFIVITALVLIIASLGSALYYLYHDRGRGTRMVRALAIRVALSAGLLIFLVVSYKLGWIGESGLR